MNCVVCIQPFIGEIKMFSGDFAPCNWAFCNGQLLLISENKGLFSIIGTTYGGDGITTFALPDLRGRTAIHPGTGVGLTARSLGEEGGSETNTLSAANLPAHSHLLANNAVDDDANTTNVSGNALANGGSYSSDSPDAITEPMSTEDTGSDSAVNNMQPFLGVNYIIALQGQYPT